MQLRGLACHWGQGSSNSCDPSWPWIIPAWDPGGCLIFLSMVPQARGEGPPHCPHLGPDLSGHPSCPLASGDNSRFPDGLVSCIPLPWLPEPGPSCSEGQDPGHRAAGPLPFLSSPLAWAPTLPGPWAGSLSALSLCPGQEFSPRWNPSPPTWGARWGPPGLQMLQLHLQVLTLLRLLVQ